jgi:EAL domain-containing protein (putative c-di-GMP-specific phosphodiesterase class I)
LPPLLSRSSRRSGSKVVAEGIEYVEQSETLRDLRCDLGQGFYFARPMEADAVLEYVRSCGEALGLTRPAGVDAP